LTRAARTALPVVLAALLGLATAIGLAGCMGGSGEAGSARDGGSIGIGVSAFPRTLDPALATDPLELQLLWLVHTPLVTYRRASGQDATDLIPGLARALPEVSEDGLTYRLSLTPGLTYSTGTPVRPGDFERAVARVRALHSPLAPLYSNIVSIEAGARSGAIVIKLARPDASFPNVLALPSSAPIPRGTPERVLSRRPPPGVGPYRLQVSGSLALLRMRNFALPGVTPGHIDRITLFRPRPPARQVQAVNAGALDVMQEPAPLDVLPELRSKYKSRYRENAAAATVALVPNTATPPFEDRAVRGAVSESLDGETLTRLYHGFLAPSCNLLPESVHGYKRLDPCPHGQRTDPPDLPDAQQQIEKAGAAGAPVTVSADPGVPVAAEKYVIRTLRKVGLKARGRPDPRDPLRSPAAASGRLLRADHRDGDRLGTERPGVRGHARPEERRGGELLGRDGPARGRRGLRGADRDGAAPDLPIRAAGHRELLPFPACFRARPVELVHQLSPMIPALSGDFLSVERAESPSVTGIFPRG
jgi:peptide/nickel transport system substrate-binding protein